MSMSTMRVRCLFLFQAAAISTIAACGSGTADGGMDMQQTPSTMTPAQTAAGTGAPAMMTAGSAGKPGGATAASAGSAARPATGAAGAATGTTTGNASAAAGTGATASAAGSGTAAAAGTSGGAAGSSTSAAAGTSGGAAGGGAATAGSATWTAVYDGLFASSAMAGCGSCHGGAANPNLNGGLAMLTDKAVTYSALVGKMSASTMCMGKPYVTAGDAEGSLLYQKIAAAPMCGMRMPPGSTLPDDKIKLVKDWIAAGAKDD